MCDRYPNIIHFRQAIGALLCLLGLLLAGCGQPESPQTDTPPEVSSLRATGVEFRILFDASRPLELKAESAKTDLAASVWHFENVQVQIPDTGLSLAAAQARWNEPERRLSLEGAVVIRLPDGQVEAESLLLDLEQAQWIAADGLRLHRDGLAFQAQRGGGAFDVSAIVWLEGVRAHLGGESAKGKRNE